MKILVDSGPLTGGHSVRGIGVNTRELFRELHKVKPQGVIITEGDTAVENLANYDIVHFSSFNPFFLSIPWNKPSNTKFVITIHDLIQLVYPKNYKPGIKGKIRFLINKYLIKKNIDAIITISETSKKDICRFLNVSPEKVYVVYLSAPSRINATKVEEVIKKYSLPKKFILYVGDVNYNKNIPTLVKASESLGVPLVLVGKQAKDIENQNLNHPELKHLKGINWLKVKRLGFIPNEEISAIYKAASVYVQPSFYEGFGMPVLEAFENQVAVVAGKTQALVEIAQGGALFFDTRSVDDLVAKIKDVLEIKTLRDQLVNTGTVILKSFSWQKAAKETMQVYENI